MTARAARVWTSDPTGPVLVRSSWHRAFGRFGFADTQGDDYRAALASGAPEIAADRGLTRAAWRQAVNGSKRYRKARRVRP